MYDYKLITCDNWSFHVWYAALIFLITDPVVSKMSDNFLEELSLHKPYNNLQNILRLSYKIK